MKLSMQQVQDSLATVNEDDWMLEWMSPSDNLDDLEPMDKEIDESVYRSSVSRKELRTKAVRDREGIVGKGNSKRRKF